jgi:uncharacterized YokU family protein
LKCQWCESYEAKETDATVYWELPDGTKAIEIKETPSITCSECGITYQTDETVNQHLCLRKKCNVRTAYEPASSIKTKLL